MTVTTPALDVLIIGAGIAGLSAAIALGKQGHRVVILEKSGFLKEAGAAIHLPPNCTALLRWMDIDPTDFGGTLLRKLNRYGYDGALEHSKNFDEIRHHWQAEWYLVHRVDLHNHLKQRALETATLHLRCMIAEVDIETARPSVALADGRTFEADLLLGADGLHSQIRPTVAPGAPAPYPVGKSCFRWLIPTEDLKQHESTADIVRDPGVFMEWAAEDRRIVAYPCSDNKMFNLCAFMPSAEATASIQSDEGQSDWQVTGDKASIAHAFSKFSPGVRKIIDSAGDKLKVWDLYDMEGLPTWTQQHAALVGDAAHPFQPYMGQGGAMAIEDAVSIATLLPLGTSRDEIPARLNMYQSLRRPRVDLVLEYTRRNGQDENDCTSARITPTEVVKFMGTCFSYNEIESCKNLLQSQ